MMGNQTYLATCRTCLGVGRDPRKRARPCPQCMGAGRQDYCSTCGNPSPCKYLPYGLDTSCEYPVTRVIEE